MIFDARPCALGEGPLWHPQRGQLYWFDIAGRRLLTRTGDEAQEWHFPETVSAAGWVGRDGLLIAGDRGLFRFDLASGGRRPVAGFPADPGIRPNDGRADRQGGFWISTMGRRAEPGAGTIWRWHRGEFRRLFRGLTVPNAICFSPDGRTAYFADTPRRRVLRVALDAAGWPAGEPEPFLDLAAAGLNPDGAAIDAAGRMWLALWGAGRVAAFAPDGSPGPAVAFAAPHTTCPALGGTTLYCTTARETRDVPLAGMVLAAGHVAEGLEEPQVAL